MTIILIYISFMAQNVHELTNASLDEAFLFVVILFCASSGRTRGGCVRCQQSHSLQLAVKVLYGFVAFLIITVAVLASLGKTRLTFVFIVYVQIFSRIHAAMTLVW